MYLYALVKPRTVENIEKNKNEVQKVEMQALNIEAEKFIKHLIYITDETNLGKIMEEIVKMNFDNRSMFQFLMAIELYVIIFYFDNKHGVFKDNKKRSPS